MPKLSRRTVVAGGLAAAVLPWLGVRSARAADFVLKLGNDDPPSHPMNIRLDEAAKRIAQETGGRVDLQIFSNNTLGGDSEMLGQVRSGALQLVAVPGNVLSTFVPVCAITGVAFSFPDYATVWKALDGDLGATIRKAIGDTGLVALDHCWDNGFRQITSSTHPVRTPDDLQGFKIRVPVSPMWTSTFRMLGAMPVSLNASEMYSALQTKIADGQENSLTILQTYKLYEVQKYCSLTSHMWEGYWMIAHGKTWNAMPADLRAIVAKHLNAAALAEREDVARFNATLQHELESKGLVFNTVDRMQFRAKLQAAGYYAEWSKKFGAAWPVLQKYAGGLG